MQTWDEFILEIASLGMRHYQFDDGSMCENWGSDYKKACSEWIKIFVDRHDDYKSHEMCFIDCRGNRNPQDDKNLGHHCGSHPKILEYIAGNKLFVKHVDQIRNFGQRKGKECIKKKSRILILLGCVLGPQRSRGRSILLQSALEFYLMIPQI